jgi:hypothetical protein
MWNCAGRSYFVNLLFADAKDFRNLRNFQDLMAVFQHLDEFH